MSTDRARYAFNVLFQDLGLRGPAQDKVPVGPSEDRIQARSLTAGDSFDPLAQNGIWDTALQDQQISFAARSHMQTFGPVRTTSHVHHDGKLFPALTLSAGYATDLAHGTEALLSTGQFAPKPIVPIASAFSALAGHPASAALHHGGMPFGSGNTAVSGQLWFGGQDLNTNNGISHIDTDGAGRVIEDSTLDADTGVQHVSVNNIGLDAADGLYFMLTADGYLRDGRITNTAHTDQSGQIQQIDQVFGTSFNADEVQALAVDPLRHIVFVGLFGQSDQYTGIIEVTYNSTTGAMTSPYNGSTGVVTDLNHMLADDPNTGGPFSNIVGMQYDIQNGKLYYIDQTNSYPGSTGSGTTWHQTNGLYVIDTTGSVGGGNAPAPSQLSLNSQFAAGDNNNYIAGFALNEAQNVIYFVANNASNSSSKLYWMPITGGTATQMSLPGGVSLGFADYNGSGSNALAFDANQRQLYISDNSDSQIVQLTLSADGHTFSGGNSDFMDFDKGTANSSSTGLYFDPLPTLSNISGTSTEVVQGGSALAVLTATPSITDPQDGVSTKLNMGYAQVVIANAQAGDQLFVNGTQSTAQDGGKIAVSWNSTTHTLTMTGADTEAEYQTLLQQISYQDSGTDSSAGSHPTRTLDFIISDGTTITNQTTLNPNEEAIALVIDRAPTLGADSYSVLEGATSTGTSGTAGTGVLGNDSDLDGDSLVVTAVNGSGANLGSGTFQGTYGHLNLASNGSYTYTADNTGNIDGAATGSHPVDTFTYTVSDGLGGVTTQTVSFTLDRAPALGSDSYAVVESGSVSGTGGTGGTGVLGNDTDKDGDSLTITAVNGSGANVGSGTFQGTYGHLNLASSGSFTYSADNTAAIDAAATGSHLTDSFTYTVSDGHGGSTTQSVTFTLDRAPAVTTQNESVAESGTNTGTGGTAGTGALAGDSDRDGDTVQVTKLDGNTINDTLSNFAGTYGHLTIGNDGSYSYVADNTAAIDGAATGSHPVDTFTLTVDDGHGGTTAETLNFAIDRPAVAAADAIATTENATAVVGGGNPNLLTNDVDKDGDAIVLTQVNGSAANVGTQITLASGALLTVNADGTYTYDPNHVFDYLPGSTSGASNTSATDSFSYAIDGGSTVTVTVTVNGVDSNDTLIGTAGADTLTGGIGDDVVYDDNGLSGKPLDTSAAASGGTDSFSGGIGDDAFYMGANLIAAGQIDGGTGTDHVILNGDYSAGLTFNATTMVNVEFLAVTAGHSYTLTLDAATVALGQTLTVQGGTLGAGDSLSLDGSADAGAFTMTSGAGNDSLSGGSAADTFTPGAGTDTVHGNGGNDLILMQGNLTAADAIDGGSGTDTLRLNGDYSAGLTFGATTVTNVETIALIAGNSYSLTIADATVASGSSLTVNGLGLGAGDTLTFDGSADLTGGTLILDGGAGNDSLTGGHANDTIRGGSGNNTLTGGAGADLLISTGTDTFVYNAVSDSTGAGHDTIKGFDAASDIFKLTGVTVHAIDTAVTHGKLDGGHVSPANFDLELGRAIGAGQLLAHDAVLFTPNSGTQSGHTFLIVDVNGTAGYQAGQDFVIELTSASNLNDLASHNFIG